MKLPQADINYIAQRAQWLFDVAFSPRNSPVAFGDNVTFTGQGLTDLNRTISVISSAMGQFPNPPPRITCEIGTQGTVLLGNAFPKYLQCDIQDIYAIKDAYIAYYGSVDKPSVYRGYGGGAFQQGVYDNTGTVLVNVEIYGTAAGSNSDYIYT